MFAFRECWLGQCVFNARQFLARVEERPERLRDFVHQSPTGVRQPILWQVTDGEACGSDDGARVGLVEPGEHPQERGFARAIGPAQADAIAVRDLPGDAVEQYTLAEPFREGGKLNQTRRQASAAGTGSPSARAVAARMRGRRKGLVM